MLFACGRTGSAGLAVDAALKALATAAAVSSVVVFVAASRVCRRETAEADRCVIGGGAADRLHPRHAGQEDRRSARARLVGSLILDAHGRVDRTRWDRWSRRDRTTIRRAGPPAGRGYRLACPSTASLAEGLERPRRRSPPSLTHRPPVLGDTSVISPARAPGSGGGRPVGQLGGGVGAAPSSPIRCAHDRRGMSSAGGRPGGDPARGRRRSRTLRAQAAAGRFRVCLHRPAPDRTTGARRPARRRARSGIVLRTTSSTPRRSALSGRPGGGPDSRTGGGGPGGRGTQKATDLRWQSQAGLQLAEPQVQRAATPATPLSRPRRARQLRPAWSAADIVPVAGRRSRWRHHDVARQPLGPVAADDVRRWPRPWSADRPGRWCRRSLPF